MPFRSEDILVDGKISILRTRLRVSDASGVMVFGVEIDKATKEFVTLDSERWASVADMPDIDTLLVELKKIML